MDLSNQSLFRDKAFIEGQWVTSDSGKTFSVINPYDGKKIANVTDCGEAEAIRAVETAHKALSKWRSTTAKERSELLRKWFDLMMENQEDLARLMTFEQGKPLAESRGEIVYGGNYVNWFSEEAKRAYGRIIPPHQVDHRIIVTQEPIGVCALIAPWNFPNAMIARKAAPALAAGCTVVIKPAQLTPLSALAMAVLAEQAGMPKGVLNIVTTSDARPVGKVFSEHPLVRKLSFTGSTEVGKKLMAQCAGSVKKVSLELGGNAPFIVFDDADIDSAIEGLVAAKYRNAGQTCICVNRVFVDESIHDVFVGKLVAATKSLKVGSGLDEGVDVGPLINEDAISSIESLITDATKKGARILIGGKRQSLSGTFFEPTVIDNVTHDMAIANEEIFGPVATVFTFKSVEEAITMANNTPYGLASYFYSDNNARFWQVMEQLEYGMVGINTGLISTEIAPFGGIKESGLGREGGCEGIHEYLETKYACVGGVRCEK